MEGSHNSHTIESQEKKIACVGSERFTQVKQVWRVEGRMKEVTTTSHEKKIACVAGEIFAAINFSVSLAGAIG